MQHRYDSDYIYLQGNQAAKIARTKFLHRDPSSYFTCMLRLNKIFAFMLLACVSFYFGIPVWRKKKGSISDDTWEKWKSEGKRSPKECTHEAGGRHREPEI